MLISEYYFHHDKDNTEFDLEKEFNLDKLPRVKANDSNAKVSWHSKSNSSEFSLCVERKDTGHLIFNTGDFSPFIYAKGFIEITTLLPNDLIYGLGQSPSKGFKHNFTIPEVSPKLIHNGHFYSSFIIFN